MNVAAPKTQAIEISNRLCDIGRDDDAELERINWQLRALAKRQPADFDIRLASARGLALRGDREAALQHAEAAFGLRWGQDFFRMANLASIVTDLGMVDRGREILNGLLGQGEARANVAADGLFLNMAAQTGDIGFLRLAFESTGLMEGPSAKVLQILERSGLLPWFPAHQRAVNGIIGPLVCTFRVALGLESFDDESLGLNYYANVSMDDAFTLMDRITDALFDAHAGHPRGEGAFIGVITTTVSGPYVPRQGERA